MYEYTLPIARCLRYLQGYYSITLTGPSTQIVGFHGPKTIQSMDFGTCNLAIWGLGPPGGLPRPADTMGSMLEDKKIPGHRAGFQARENAAAGVDGEAPDLSGVSKGTGLRGFLRR